MTGAADKVKEKLKGAKDKVVETKDKVIYKAVNEKDSEAVYTTGDTVTTKTTTGNSSRESTYTKQGREFEEGSAGTRLERKSDSTKEYDANEPMSPAKIKEHEPTAVKRDMTEKIGQSGSDSEKAKEIARRSGMAKGTAGVGETGDEYEQGAAGTNK